MLFRKKDKADDRDQYNLMSRVTREIELSEQAVSEAAAQLAIRKRQQMEHDLAHPAACYVCGFSFESEKSYFSCPRCNCKIPQKEK